MKYSDLISFDPIESVIQLTAADDSSEAVKRVKSYVMSNSMAEQIKNNILSQLSLDDVIDNKGVLLVGNYGTGKSHLMSVVSAIALDDSNLVHLRNNHFADDARCIAGRFEVVRIEIGAVTTPLREIIFNKIQQDFKARGLTLDYPNASSVTNNKETLLHMMELFGSKYPGKGYLILVDEFLDFLGGKDERSVRFDLGFLREIGEVVKISRLRIILGVQEKLFDNPRFSFVADTINRIRDRFEQFIIRKEDTAYVVSERILNKTDEQKAIIRDHLQKFCNLYSNMSERMEEYVSLYPIHPSYIDVFNKIYIIENRHILANISKIIGGILNDDISEDMPGILSFDSYWIFIKDNFSYRTDANIKEVVEKSGQLEDIINRSFPKKLYKPLAVKIIYALSVHRLTTGDIQLRAGLTSENMRDDLCLYLPGLPDQSSDTLQSLVQAVLKDVMTTVSGQFIDHDSDNGQYYLDLKKDVDYDEKITQRAATLADDSLNTYFYDTVYFCLDWDEQEYVKNFKIYEHTLNWDSHQIFRRGYLFLGKPEDRSTAQPPEDYYIYFVPPYGNTDYTDEKRNDEVFFIFKNDEVFKNNLKLYAAACILRDLAEDKNKSAYQAKADAFRKRLTRHLSENRNTAFDVSCCGIKKSLLEVMKGRYKQDNPFKETMDLVASLLFEPYFSDKYPEFPKFKTVITQKNRADATRRALDRFSGRKEQLGNLMLDSFGLISGENITIQNSKYAKYYANMLDNLPAGAVLNFSDVYTYIESSSGVDVFFDKKFLIGYSLLPVVFLGLVYTGRAVIALKNGTVITASNLENIPKINAMDISDFKHISKPKDLQLGELVRLYEILDLPEGLIRNEQSREAGVERLIAKTQTLVQAAVKAKTKLDGEFSLWGEPLIASHVVSKYKEAVKNVIDMLGNFHTRFNTVAKLNNFTYTMAEVERFGDDIAAVNVVLEYDLFRNECLANVSYMMSIESVESVKQRVENVKEAFRKNRDEIADGKFGEMAAVEINEEFAKVKASYIDYYFDEHKKRRLDVKSGKAKSDLISSVKYANLKRLSEIDILSASKLTAIGNDLAALKVCIDLTPEMLKTSHFCPKCGFQLGSNDPFIKGAIDRIEDRLDTLLNEWIKTLINTITDPLVADQKSYLSTEQQSAINEFVKHGAFLDKIDVFLVNAIKELLKGFEAVTIDGELLTDELVKLGPCDLNTFNAKVSEFVSKYIKGKDKSKLRIIVKGSTILHLTTVDRYAPPESEDK